MNLRSIPSEYINLLSVTLVILTSVALSFYGKNSSDILSQLSHRLTVPEGYQLLDNTTHYTDTIGTVDHPTIDGGIVNTPDRKILKAISVSHVPSVIKKSASIDSPFNDAWANSAHVKALLKEAVKEGKLNYVLQKSESMGIPASIAVVPMVESHYQTKAISPKGAGGAWQIMPMVAKQYGLNKDEQFQFTPATNVALHLLKSLHQEFGNWELALAAYNAGGQRVRKALQKNPHAKHIDELSLPLETKRYVKRIMAINSTLDNLSFAGT